MSYADKYDDFVHVTKSIRAATMCIYKGLSVQIQASPDDPREVLFLIEPRDEAVDIIAAAKSGVTVGPLWEILKVHSDLHTRMKEFRLMRQHSK